MANHEQYSTQNDQNPIRPETNFDYEASANGQTMRSEFLDGVPSKNEEEQVIHI